MQRLKVPMLPVVWFIWLLKPHSCMFGMMCMVLTCKAKMCDGHSWKTNATLQSEMEDAIHAHGPLSGPGRSSNYYTYRFFLFVCWYLFKCPLEPAVTCDKAEIGSVPKPLWHVTGTCALQYQHSMTTACMNTSTTNAHTTHSMMDARTTDASANSSAMDANTNSSSSNSSNANRDTSRQS